MQETEHRVRWLACTGRRSDFKVSSLFVFDFCLSRSKCQLDISTSREIPTVLAQTIVLRRWYGRSLVVPSLIFGITAYVTACPLLQRLIFISRPLLGLKRHSTLSAHRTVVCSQALIRRQICEAPECSASCSFLRS